jgi:N4-gp56 family major capsid protein
LYYGDYITLTDKVNIESIDPVLTVAAERLGEQVGQSLDKLMRDVMNAGTTKQYASTAVSRVTVAAGMYFNNAECQEAVLTLKLNLAKPVTARLDPSTGYNTVPVKAAFIGIIHPLTTSYLENNEAKWTPLEKYSNKNDIMPQEVGSLPYVRFIESNNAKVFTGEGASGIDVYSTLIFGQRAYHATRLSTLVLQNIVKPLGSSGTADPLNQRATSGWKLSFVGKITQQSWLIRVEHAN